MLKLFDGFTYHLKATLAGSNDTLCYMRVHPPLTLRGREDLWVQPKHAHCSSFWPMKDNDLWLIGAIIDQWFRLFPNYFAPCCYYYAMMWSRWREWIIVKECSSSYRIFTSQSVCRRWQRSRWRCLAASVRSSSARPQRHQPSQFAQLSFTL